MAGAFCLIGWVVLAVFGAGAASASENSTTEHSAGGAGLGDVVTTVLGNGSAESTATTEQAGPRGRATGDRSQQPARPAPAAGQTGIGSALETTSELVGEISGTAGDAPLPAPEATASPAPPAAAVVTESLRPAAEALTESDAAADWSEAGDQWNEAVADWQSPKWQGFDDLDLIPDDETAPGHDAGEASPAPAAPAGTQDGDRGTTVTEARGTVAAPAPARGDATTTTPDRRAAAVGTGDRPADAPSAPGNGQWPAGTASTSTSTSTTGGSGNGTPLAYGGPVGVHAQRTLLGVARASDDLAPLGDAVKPDTSPD